MPTQIIAFALFELLRRRFPQWDVYELLRLATGEVIPWQRLQKLTDVLLNELRDRADDDEFHLSPMGRDEPPEQLVEAGLDNLASYHVPAVIERMGDGVLLNKLDLLYYYGNRLRSYDIDVDELLARANLRADAAQ
jgi:hypothetical protein